jgi:spore maturation protein CgeB
VILLWRATQFDAHAVRQIRAAGDCPVISYNNDDPFSPAYRDGTLGLRRLWRNFLGAIPTYDMNFVFRPVNVDEYLSAGAKRVNVLLPYFMPEVHRPVALSEKDLQEFGCDAVFVGHYEEDGRVEKLAALVRAGMRLRIFGNGWPFEAIHRIDPNLAPPRSALGDQYAKALCGAKLCLSFLSKLNRDTYTRRSFEIPACGKLMLSERTRSLETMFSEDHEAVFFSSTEELVSKAQEWVTDDTRRETVARAGLDRCWSGGHDVLSRMRGMMMLCEKELGLNSR